MDVPYNELLTVIHLLDQIKEKSPIAQDKYTYAVTCKYQISSVED